MKIAIYSLWVVIGSRESRPPFLVGQQRAAFPFAVGPFGL